ncbi:Spermidine export protein MdtI [Salmonella enterica subsp. enterica serovar Alachua str. R6-377]|uniref:Spermidine export protein MdtI n=1 Tax=Salmonella enterica subsp. enterica serovar Alachua str. R6-377 TaxID=913241 RepID=G5LLS8_SALET|nr:Spermidine export protein MdtI [Salmonella enterica subsp. enterica serovar Alachua str. R6-377]
MQQFEWIHGAWLGLAIMLEIAANVLLKFSDGFRRKCYGILSLGAVLAAFSALSQAVKGIDLSVAYALWGGFGIAATLAPGLGALRPHAGGGLGALRPALKPQRLGWRDIAARRNGHDQICLRRSLPVGSGSDSRINPAPELSAYRESR